MADDDDDDDDDDDEGAFVGHETISMTCSHNSRVFFSHIWLKLE